MGELLRTSRRLFVFGLLFLLAHLPVKSVDAARLRSAGSSLQRKRPPLVGSGGKKFKILQLADLHFGEDPGGTWGPEQDTKTIAVMEKVLDSEKPDFVVFSGDQVTSEALKGSSYGELQDPETYHKKAIAPLEKRKIPWAVIFGNHDDCKTKGCNHVVRRGGPVIPGKTVASSMLAANATTTSGQRWLPDILGEAMKMLPFNNPQKERSDSAAAAGVGLALSPNSSAVKDNNMTTMVFRGRQEFGEQAGTPKIQSSSDPKSSASSEDQQKHRAEETKGKIKEAINKIFSTENSKSNPLNLVVGGNSKQIPTGDGAAAEQREKELKDGMGDAMKEIFPRADHIGIGKGGKGGAAPAAPAAPGAPADPAAPATPGGAAVPAADQTADQAKHPAAAPPPPKPPPPIHKPKEAEPKSDALRETLLTFDQGKSLSYTGGEEGPYRSAGGGVSNYYLLLYSDEAAAKADKPSTVLWFLDTGGGEIPEIVYRDQVEWLKSTAEHLRRKYGKTLPGMLYAHIPTQPFTHVNPHAASCQGVVDDFVTPTLNDHNLFHVVSTANIDWVFAGHNHGNDWCCPVDVTEKQPDLSEPTPERGKWNINLCYGRHSGYGGYATPGMYLRGARVVEIDLDMAEKHVAGQASHAMTDSYVRLENGETLAQTDSEPVGQGGGMLR